MRCSCWASNPRCNEISVLFHLHRSSDFLLWNLSTLCLKTCVPWSVRCTFIVFVGTVAGLIEWRSVSFCAEDKRRTLEKAPQLLTQRFRQWSCFFVSAAILYWNPIKLVFLACIFTRGQMFWIEVLSERCLISTSYYLYFFIRWKIGFWLGSACHVRWGRWANPFVGMVLLVCL